VLQTAPAHGLQPVLVISADAAAFSDSERAEAGEVLSSLGPTQVNRLYQLSVVDLARVIIEIWPSLAIGVAGSGLATPSSGLFLAAENRPRSRFNAIVRMEARPKRS
jgi:hypothetical protein